MDPMTRTIRRDKEALGLYETGQNSWGNEWAALLAIVSDYQVQTIKTHRENLSRMMNFGKALMVSQVNGECALEVRAVGNQIRVDLIDLYTGRSRATMVI